MNNKLKGVVIDPGHGGVDSGAIGSDTLEKDYNLLISRYMYDRFSELGIPVYLTRDSDITLEPNARTKKIQSFLGKDSNVIVISNHLNAGGGSGAEVIYSLRNDSKLSNMILNNISLLGINKRRVYQRRLPSDNTKDYYYILRDTPKNESIIIEYGFIDNEFDLNFLKENYMDLAEQVIKSVLEYKGIKYVPPITEITDTYQVILGDTLYSIAKKLDTTVAEIKKINNLTSDVLSVGQIIKIPSKIVDVGDTVLYSVKKGDTLYSLAKMFNTTVSYLKEINSLQNDNLSVGMLISVPSGLSIVNTYKVVSGDTLYGIAKKFNISIDKIKEANNLTSNMIGVGQVLIIPKKDTTYVVKKGDTLYGISKMFDMPIDDIKKLNGLSSDVLNVGQILIVDNV